MQDITNKTLAFLIGIAIVISVVGILSMPKGGISILGAVTNISTGTANVSVQSVTQIRLNNNTVDFGIGFINSSDTRCILESNDSSRHNDSGGTTITPCDKAGGGPGFNAPAITPNFAVENIGNINITLRINSSFFGGAFYGSGAVGTSAGFLCDPATTARNCSVATAEYNWSAQVMEQASCTSDQAGAPCPPFGPSGCMTSRNRFNQSLVGTSQIICNNMDFLPTRNEIRVAIRLGIPRDSRQGLLTDTVSFIADTG